MPAWDTRGWIDTLESKGHLRRISAEVDPELEITEITQRVVREKGPALLFENVRGSDVPVLINQFGHWDRLVMLLGREPEAVGRELAALAKPEIPHGIREGIEALSRFKDILSFPPKDVDAAPCQQVVREGDDATIDWLPILRCWPKDPARFITLPQVITRDPETGDENLGIYRMQRYDGRTTGMHWQTHKHGRRHMESARRRGERLEVAVAIGGDPLLQFAAAAPLPDGFSEYMFAGFLRKHRVPLVKAKTVDLRVPADAEIVLEGWVDPAEARTEGPFGDHTGYYSWPDRYPVFHIECVTHRERPIYPTTVVGPPPAEDWAIGKAVERMFLPLLQLQLPEIVDMHLPVAGQFHNLAIVSIRKRYPGHARKVMFALWGLGQMALEKCIIVVDDWVDVHDADEVLWIVTASTDPARDVFTVDRTPTDDLDHAAPLPHFGSKLGIDATHKWKEEGYGREWPERIEMDKDVADRVTRRWKEYGL